MGMDIIVSVDNAEDFLFDHDLADNDDWRNQHELSRSFCNLMCRRDVVQGEPELDQIGRLADIDVTPLYDMMAYWTEENIEEAIEFDSDLNEDDFREECLKDNKRLENNIHSTIKLIAQLTRYLDEKSDVSSEMNHHDFDTLGDEYFKDLSNSDFTNYLDNNLNQDLKNLIRVAEFGRINDAKTMYFELC